MEDALEAPYTSEELARGVDVSSVRGPLCEACGRRVPRFADLAAATRSRIGRLINQGRKGVAAGELAHATGCPLPWAGLWVLHRGRPRRSSDRRPGCLAASETPCPYCGEPLRTSRAKQCPHCLRDWHDPVQVGRLGS